MKLNATINMKVMNLFDEERNVTVKSRSYTIVNEEDLRNALKRMRPDVETRILDMALYQSGLIISNINNIHIMYNKYVNIQDRTHVFSLSQPYTSMVIAMQAYQAHAVSHSQ